MLTISETRYVPVKPNYIVLQDADGYFYYINRTLYDEAIVLTDRYGRSISTLIKLIGGNSDFQCVESFVIRAPKSISILGYFLALLSEDIEDDYTDVVGALDLITSNLDPRTFIKQPAEIRQSVNFGMSIRNEYMDSWEMFFDSCYEYEWMSSVLREARTGGYVKPATRSYSNNAIEEDVEDEEDAGDVWADLMADFEKEDAEADAKLKTPEVKEEPAPVAAPSTDGGNGLDIIRKRRAR